METFTLVYVILISIAGGYGAWWLYKAVNSIAANINDLRTNKHSRLTSYLENVKAAVSTSKGEITTSICNSDKSIKAHVTTENNAIKQMIMAQFSSQTSKLVEDVEINRHTLSNLVSMVQNLQSQTSKGIKENSNKIGELNSSISYAISETASRTKEYIQHLSSEGQQHSKAILADIDMVFRNVSEFNQAIERHLKLLEETDDKNTKRIDTSIASLSSSLKLHKEDITSIFTQILNTESELHQKTKSSFDVMNGQLSKYLLQLKQIDVLYDNLQKLYTKLLGEEEKISKQESSLASMVSRHSQIFEITSEMNNTSKEIFEFMKLYLIQSTLDNFKR